MKFKALKPKGKGNLGTAFKAFEKGKKVSKIIDSGKKRERK